ncbi:MAG: cytochrome b/b6 domain-containing protein [Rhodospirillales bacterium]
MTPTMTPRQQQTLLLFWHAWFGGGYLVTYLTADEDTYGMHLFAGYAVLAAVIVRVLVGLIAPNSKLLKLPQPKLGGLSDWFRSGKGRHPFFSWFAATLLIVIGAAAATGALSDSLMTWLEDPHEAISEASLWVIFAHIAFVTFMYGGKKFIRQAVTKLADRLPFTHA